MKLILKSLILLIVFMPVVALAQFTPADSIGEIRKGRVLEIVSQEEDLDFIKGTPITIQELRVEDISSGDTIEVYNDYRTVRVGQKIFFSVNDFGEDNYQNILIGVSRINHIIALVLLFILVVVVFSGKKGIRSLIALSLSFLAIFFIMIPFILKGINPLIVGPGIAFVILFFAIFFSYGFNKISAVAFLGTSITVVITSLLAVASIDFFSLSGLTDETSVYLSFLSDTPINLVHLLTAGIIIGVLGVLDDIAVTQVAVVRELYLSNKGISESEVYTRAISVGQDHVSALVNTLVLAYVGVALPLILVVHLSSSGLSSTLSQEVFAAEIVRTIVGSIGVVLAVPITTFLAVRILGKKRDELSAIHFDGGHSHGHEEDHHHHNHS